VRYKFHIALRGARNGDSGSTDMEGLKRRLECELASSVFEGSSDAVILSVSRSLVYRHEMYIFVWFALVL